MKRHAESDVGIETLVAYLRDSGRHSCEVQPDGIALRAGNGFDIHIALITAGKFIRFSALLPLNPEISATRKRELMKRLNENAFPRVFASDRGQDLSVAYVMPYGHGLIAENFVATVSRFASLLEFVVQDDSGDGRIDLGSPAPVPAAVCEASEMAVADLAY
ncbi:hypothetical protein [Burkholderia guangdongensis]|uniref:hypothetical protein n=1 Tax=Burkholderia guangdongensis TaxID=1792500 RepID=UPI0015CC2414|nr:hypothetical protein [Burkholderia guangdongensis]